MRCRFLQSHDHTRRGKSYFKLMLQGSQIHWKMETYLEPLDPCADFNPLVSKPAVEEDICAKSTKVLFNICRPIIKRIHAIRSGSLKMEMIFML